MQIEMLYETEEVTEQFEECSMRKS